jgi:hypothetical protein
MPVPAVPMPEPLSIWHFVLYLSVWLAFFTALFNAFIGILGINAVKPDTTKWPTWIWFSWGAGLILAIGIGWQTASQIQDTDLQKRTADQRYDLMQKKLDGISAHDTEVSDALKNIASAAHISPDQATGEIVKGITALLTVEKNTGAVVTGGTGNIVGGEKATISGNITAARIDRQYNSYNYGSSPSTRSDDRDADTFYQLGKKVATVSGANPDWPRSKISFSKILEEPIANPSHHFEYRNLILDCVDGGKELPFPGPPPGTVAGTVMPTLIVEWTCKIVKERDSNPAAGQSHPSPVTSPAFSMEAGENKGNMTQGQSGGDNNVNNGPPKE